MAESFDAADAADRPAARRTRNARRLAGDVALLVVVAVAFVIVLNGGWP